MTVYCYKVHGFTFLEMSIQSLLCTFALANKKHMDLGVLLFSFQRQTPEEEAGLTWRTKAKFKLLFLTAPQIANIRCLLCGLSSLIFPSDSHPNTEDRNIV